MNTFNTTNQAPQAQQEQTMTGNSGYSKIVESVVTYVLSNFAEEINLDDLAREAGMSRFNFCRRFHKECGVPPMRWLWNFRTILAAEFINLDPRWSLTDVAFSCGFSSSAHFSRSFKAMFGKSPSLYRKEVEAMQENFKKGDAQGQLSPVPADAAFDLLFTNNQNIVRRAANSALGG